MDFIEVEILNWAKFNPRKDFKAPRWFAMSNRILEDAAIDNLTDSELKAWIYVLCQASQQNKPYIQIFFAHAERICRIKKSVLIAALKKLEASRTVSVRKSTDRVHETNATLHYITEQDSTEQNTTSAYAPRTAGAARANNFIAGYCERFKNRWGNNPPITGKDAGIAKRLAKQFTEEKLNLYLDAFFSMPDSWVLKTKHPLSAFETKLNEIVVYATSGAFTTTRDARNADETNTVAAQLKRIREGKV